MVTKKEGSGAPAPYDLAELPSYASGKIQAVSDEEFAKLLGRPVPSGEYPFYKKKRMVIDENCTVCDLRYSKRWVGRFFSWGVRFGIGFFRAFGNKTMANTLVMGVLHQPVRGLAKFTGMTRRKMEALLLMFNGHFFKGFGRFLTKGKKRA